MREKESDVDGSVIWRRGIRNKGDTDDSIVKVAIRCIKQ